jgi:DNA-binding beta-propeller fold protein YncE
MTTPDSAHPSPETEPPSPAARTSAPRKATGRIPRADLLLGVGVVGLLLVLAGVPGKGSEAARAVVASETVISDALGLAHALALSTGSPHGVAFDPAGDQLAVLDADGQLVKDPVSGEQMLADISNSGLVDLQIADCGPGGNVFVIDAHGVPLAGGRMRLHCQGHDVDYTLDAATGRLVPVEE